MSIAFRLERTAAGPVPFQVRGPDGVPVAAINDFLAYLVVRGRSGYTLRSYGTGLAHFFGWVEDRSLNVNDVSRQLVGEYIVGFASGPKIDSRVHSATSRPLFQSSGDRHTAGRQPRTINHRVSLLASYFSYRIQRDQERGGGAWFQRDNPASPTVPDSVGHRNPAACDFARRRRQTGDFRRRVPRKAPKGLDPGCIGRLIDAAASWRDKALLTLLCRTGQRIGDWGEIAGRHGVLGMTLGDFDRQRGMITVLLKGSRDEHRVPITDDFWSLFERYLTDERSAAATTPAAWLAMRKGRGEPLSYTAFESSLRYTARKIGLKVHAHQFRHTLAQGVLETTGNLKVAQEILGHAHLSTTADLYMHVDYAAMVDAIVAAKATSDRERDAGGQPSVPFPERYAFPYDEITMEELEKVAAQAQDHKREQDGGGQHE
jgi:site-specific recombinase XerD